MSVLRNTSVHRKKMKFFIWACTAIFAVLVVRLSYLMIVEGDYYSAKATQLHERERNIKASRGLILDRNGVVLAGNVSVCTISVIHNQITDSDRVVEVLSKELGISPDSVRKSVEKYTSIERIKSNVDKETGDRIRAYDLDGVKVDEDYKRYYPYEELASKVLGFTGADNQGIIGLEVKYDEYLQGEPGQILTMTDARGIEFSLAGERRDEPEAGDNLVTTLDINIQAYATQLAYQAMESKEAESVSIIVMNPKNGEIYAMASVPEFNPNKPFSLPEEQNNLTGEARQDALNQMWRNGCVNDTYEPGSTFKVITGAAGLEEGVVTRETGFSCPGYIIVEDRKIKCHKVGGHGSLTFEGATMSSCNPSYINVGLRLGIEKFYDYFEKFGLFRKTGIDLPGEAGTIMHKEENMGLVELACVAFGQSFQITPIQLLTTISSIINGGTRITPHFGNYIADASGMATQQLVFPEISGIVSEETSRTMREMLEKVVSEGGGSNGKVEGFSVGGKTATSQTLPRGTGRYISSFVGFAPAEDPQVIAIAIVTNPKGLYYGGLVAAPIIRQLYENILPYLGIAGN
ncbi:MAG: peptidoglycan glycosyltransferase [Lachnospiraceae bacterium]|nr:peptidoglycan glycosyltransferase [Lachnospiraceae bacterium]